MVLPAGKLIRRVHKAPGENHRSSLEGHVKFTTGGHCTGPSRRATMLYARGPPNARLVEAVAGTPRVLVTIVFNNST